MELDFAFAFNDAKFSDRILRVEVTGDGESSCSSIADLIRDGKRRRLDCNNGNSFSVWDLECREAMVTGTEESESESDYVDEKLTTRPLVPRVREIHISSPILAAKSPFFFKLFSNGMLESEQRHVTLSIDVSEEVAVMELLNFMYSNSLSVTTTPALLDVLMAADKFEVSSCIKYCSHLLLNTPMTVDSALLLLDLPSTVLATDSVKPLTNAARQFLASHYKDLHKLSAEEVSALPLVGIEAILASDDLEIGSEDFLYNFALKWAKTHYSDLEECQEIFGSRLAPYIRFPHMTCRKLKEIVTSSDFRPHVASSLILEALFFKAESMNHQRTLANERAYKHRPIQVVKFEIPRHQCIVYLDLTRKECAGLYPKGQLFSQMFSLGGLEFILCAYCNMDQPSSFHHFGLGLGLIGRQTESPIMDYKFSVRSKPTEEFVGKFKGSHKFTRAKLSENRNLFDMPWESFISKDCPYFINDILHLRARLSIRH